MKKVLLIYLCLCSLAIHLFIDHTAHLNTLDRFHQVAEQRGELDHSDYEHEDDFSPYALAFSNGANDLKSNIDPANLMAFSQTICPPLPPPKSA